MGETTEGTPPAAVGFERWHDSHLIQTLASVHYGKVEAPETEDDLPQWVQKLIKDTMNDPAHLISSDNYSVL